jgi:hypothetical protein
MTLFRMLCLSRRLLVNMVTSVTLGLALAAEPGCRMLTVACDSTGCWQDNISLLHSDAAVSILQAAGQPGDERDAGPGPSS